jgi:hypothetical protein
MTTISNAKRSLPLTPSPRRPLLVQKRMLTAAKVEVRCVRSGATTKELSLEWKARKETTDEKNKTGKEPFGENLIKNQMQK